MNRMKGLLLCVAVLLIVVGAKAQTQDWTWACSAGGNGYDVGNEIATDSYGNSYIIGHLYSDTADFGAISLISSGLSDIFVAKLDSTGNWLWAKRAGGVSSDVGFGISIDYDGNVYITGTFSGTAVFGYAALISNGIGDIFIAKLDTNGTWLWAESAGGINNDYGISISTDSSGNSYVAGYFSDSATLGNTTLISSDNDIFIAKLDTDGNWMWATSTIDQSSGYGGLDLACDSDGYSYITGQYQGTAEFGVISLAGIGYPDVFVAKLDTYGNWLWACSAGSTNSDGGEGISIDSDNNVYITGEYYDNAIFGSFSLTSSGGFDIFIAKLDVNGNWLWAKRAGGTDLNDHSLDIITNSRGDSYITGYFGGTAHFGTTTYTIIGGSDVFIAKLDTQGNWIWASHAGESNQVSGHGISIDSSGNCFIIGYFREDAYFGTSTLHSSGLFDIFTAKFLPPTPLASFSTDTTEGLVPLTVQFTDNSLPRAGQITEWFWDFGDGITSTIQNPSHLYSSFGVYSVSLTIINSLGFSDSVVSENCITVLDHIQEIQLVTNESMMFGGVYVEENSSYQVVKFHNKGTVDLSISDVYFFDASTQFELFNPFHDLIFAPGQSDSLMVRFTPHRIGTILDTLYIVNSSVNEPLLRITLRGIGLIVPPKPPQNPSITMSGSDAQLHWEAVTENLHDQAIVPDYYLVFSSDNPYGAYVYHGVTTFLNYIFPLSAVFQSHMFYKVRAYRYYGRGVTISDIGLEPGMPEEDAIKILNLYR